MDNLPQTSPRGHPFWATRGRRRRYPASISTSRPNRLSLTPLQELPLTINPQSDSPLYNGRIPPEIRDQIFKYAMTEYTKTDPASQYPESTEYTRPGYTGKRAVTVALLLTCRRVYMETYHLPPACKEHVFWHGRWPDHALVDPYRDEHEELYFGQLQPWQMALVREVHLFTQMFWLEQNLASLCRKEFMQGVERLRITIRRGDWWWNERNASLGICPQSGSAQDEDLMGREWEMERRGVATAWRDDAWGCAFRELKSLKELEMVLETSEDKVGELKAIVEKAKGWRFPLKDGMVLSTEGLRMESMEWRSGLCFWSKICPYCGLEDGCGSSRGVNIPPLEKCVEKTRLQAEEKGPMCTAMTLRWRQAKVDV